MKGWGKEGCCLSLLLINEGICLCWPIIKFTLATVLIQLPILLWYIAHLCYRNSDLLVQVFSLCYYKSFYLLFTGKKWVVEIVDLQSVSGKNKIQPL